MALGPRSTERSHEGEQVSNEKPISIGSLLAHMRWSKATKEERMRIGRMLVDARVAKAAKRKKRAKS